VGAGLHRGKLNDFKIIELNGMEPESERTNENIKLAALIINLRWICLLGILVFLLVPSFFTGQNLSELGWILILVGLYNTLAARGLKLYEGGKRLLPAAEHRISQSILFALDITCLNLALFFLGWVELYLLPVVLVISIAAALILSRKQAFILAGLAAALLGGMLWLNNAESIRQGITSPFLGREVSAGWLDILKILIPGAGLLFLGVHMSSAISSQYSRLLVAERRARQQAEILQHMGVVLSSTLEQEQLLGLVLKYLMKLVPSDSSTIMLIQGKKARVVAARGELNSSHILPDEITLPGDSLFQEVVEGHRYILIQDAASDPRSSYFEGMDSMQSCICVPLVAHSCTIGLLTIGSAQPNFYRDSDAILVQSFAGHVALALDNARLYREMRHSAHTDGLTGLYNRRYLYQELERELARSRRYGHPLSLVICDLDNFKMYNDQYGHLAGDDLLRELGEMMNSFIRKSDTAFRYGGEEFAIILPHTDQGSALVLAERLREAINQKSFLIREKLQIGHITISIGVASYPEDAVEVDSLINSADMALYEAKKTKNCVCTYLPIEV
jgi:diguanylate cyclase (GGDEF)-like protein